MQRTSEDREDRLDVGDRVDVTELIARIAAEVGTPTYVYSTATLQRHYRVFHEALTAHPGLGEPFITYAVKACPNVSVLRTLALAGAGAASPFLRRFGLAFAPSASTRTFTSSLRPLMKSTTRTTS